MNIKQLIGEHSANYLLQTAMYNIIGMGTGSTVNELIRALAPVADKFKGAVATSIATENLLHEVGIKVFSTNEVQELDIYIDGADEITPHGYMIKGGGGALTREKIIASIAKKFICIADNSKQVHMLGNFPLPVEVLPVAFPIIFKYLENLGSPILRMRNNEIFVSENHGYIIDVHDMKIENPLEMEARLNNIAGIINNGIFAQQKAHILITNQQINQEQRIITIESK